MRYWAEIRNNYFESGSDVDRNLEGAVLATISIDAWKTMDDNEEGCVIARVLLSNHGDILVDYHDNVARVDTAAQEAIAEAKKELETYYRESVIGLAERAQEAAIGLWARLGVSLSVTPDELAALKHPYDQNAKNLLVDLVRSNRCVMSGDTYFPKDCNEEFIGEMEEDLAFDLDCALHDNERRQAAISPAKIEAAKQCLVDNGIEVDEAETVLQALGYALLDRELFPQADVDLGFYEASIFEASSGKYLADEHQGKFELGPKDERLLFYDEADAERVLALLNEVSDLCFVLIDERLQEKDNTIVALDDVIASAEKASSAQIVADCLDNNER